MRYGVAPGFPSSASRRGVAQGRNGRPAPLPCGTHALLAQLVEHFHGKEGVAGSSPAEGSQNPLVTAGFLVYEGADAASTGARGPLLGRILFVSVQRGRWRKGS